MVVKVAISGEHSQENNTKFIYKKNQLAMKSRSGYNSAVTHFNEQINPKAN